MDNVFSYNWFVLSYENESTFKKMILVLKQSPPPSSPNPPPPPPTPLPPYTHRFQKGLSVQKSKNKVTKVFSHVKMAENLSNASSPLKNLQNMPSMCLKRVIMACVHKEVPDQIIYSRSLRELDTPGLFFAIFYKGEHDFLFENGIILASQKNLS